MASAGAPARRLATVETIGRRSRHRHSAFLRHTGLAVTAERPHAAGRRARGRHQPALTLAATDAVHRAFASIAGIRRSTGDRLAHVLIQRALDRLAEIDENLRFLQEGHDAAASAQSA